VSEVCKEFAIDKEAVIKKGMKKNKARDMAIYLSGNHSGITCKELGMYFGNVSGTIIQWPIRNGDELTSPTMHHSFRPSLPDFKVQKS